MCVAPKVDGRGWMHFEGCACTARLVFVASAAGAFHCCCSIFHRAAICISSHLLSLSVLAGPPARATHFQALATGGAHCAKESSPNKFDSLCIFSTKPLVEKQLFRQRTCHAEQILALDVIYFYESFYDSISSLWKNLLRSRIFDLRRGETSD
jgi:hypothetical protein